MLSLMNGTPYLDNLSSKNEQTLKIQVNTLRILNTAPPHLDNLGHQNVISRVCNLVPDGDAVNDGDETLVGAAQLSGQCTQHVHPLLAQLGTRV